MASPGLGCRRPRLPLRMPGRMDSRLTPVWGGMGMPDQQSHGARLQGGQCPPSRSSLLNAPPPSGGPGSALGHPLSFAHRAGTPGFLQPPEWGPLGGISQSLLAEAASCLPPRLGRAEGGGREAGRGERRKGKKLAGQQQSCVCIHRREEARAVWGGPGAGEAFLPLCSPSSPPPGAL